MLNAFYGAVVNKLPVRVGGYASDGEAPARAPAEQQDGPRSPPARAASFDDSEARILAKNQYNTATNNAWTALRAAKGAVESAATCGRQTQKMLNDLDELRTRLTKGRRDADYYKEQLDLVETQNETGLTRLIQDTKTIKDRIIQFDTRKKLAIQVEDEYAQADERLRAAIAGCEQLRFVVSHDLDQAPGAQADINRMQALLEQLRNGDIKSVPIHQVDQDLKAVLDLFPKEPPALQNQPSPAPTPYSDLRGESFVSTPSTPPDTLDAYYEQEQFQSPDYPGTSRLFVGDNGRADFTDRSEAEDDLNFSPESVDEQDLVSERDVLPVQGEAHGHGLQDATFTDEHGTKHTLQFYWDSRWNRYRIKCIYCAIQGHTVQAYSAEFPVCTGTHMSTELKRELELLCSHVSGCDKTVQGNTLCSTHRVDMFARKEDRSGSRRSPRLQSKQKSGAPVPQQGATLARNGHSRSRSSPRLPSEQKSRAPAPQQGAALARNGHSRSRSSPRLQSEKKSGAPVPQQGAALAHKGRSHPSSSPRLPSEQKSRAPVSQQGATPARKGRSHPPSFSRLPSEQKSRAPVPQQGATLARSGSAAGLGNSAGNQKPPPLPSEGAENLRSARNGPAAGLGNAAGNPKPPSRGDAAGNRNNPPPPPPGPKPSPA